MENLSKIKELKQNEKIQEFIQSKVAVKLRLKKININMHMVYISRYVYIYKYI